MAGRCRPAGLLVLHALLAAWYATTVSSYLTNCGKLSSVATYGGHWKFLTFIDLILQLVYFGLCVLVDILTLSQDKGKQKDGNVVKTLTQLRDKAFATMAFPMAVFVMISFWIIYAIDRELIYPKELDSVIPQWQNQAMHTTILPIVLVEMYASRHLYPSKKAGIATTTAVCLTYILWILWVKHHANIWVYPFLNELNLEASIIFFSFSYIVMLAFYILGEKLNNLCWVAESKKKIR